MKKGINYLLLLAVFCGLLQVSFGQEVSDISTQWRIETNDGNEFLGIIVSEDANVLNLSTKIYGVITIKISDIKRRKAVKTEKIVEGELWYENPQATRYFFAPNGYGLKKGEGYYQNVWVLVNQASVGFTKYFSVGVGVVPLFLFAAGATPVWVTPKISFPVVKEKFNMGAGALLGTVLGEEEPSFGITYGIATIGDKNTNLNFGVGYGFAAGEWAESPMITLGAMARINRRSYFVTENYYIRLFDENVTLISLGGRTVWSRVSLDYGLVVPFMSDMGDFIAIPWLGFVVPMGK